MTDWSAEVKAAEAAKVSIPPDATLPQLGQQSLDQTLVSVVNRTTLAAARAMIEDGNRPLALNFANGVEPGGGFLRGATAQEETLCRSSALYATLFGDPMYDFHRENHPAASSDWAILGRGCSKAGLEAIIVTSSQNEGGRNIVLFPFNLSKASKLQVLRAEQLPK